MSRGWGPFHLIGSLRANLGMPGLLLGVFSLVSFGFGLVVLARETDQLRRTGRDALRPVIASWVRTLPLDYLGATLADYVDHWRRAQPDERAARLAELRAALNHLGDLFDRPDIRRTRLFDVIALDLGPTEEEEGPPLASWRPRMLRRTSPQDRIDRVPVLESASHDPLIELVVRYRIAPEIEAAATAFETRYRHLALALLGLSLFPLLCLLYMALQAGILRAGGPGSGPRGHARPGRPHLPRAGQRGVCSGQRAPQPVRPPGAHGAVPGGGAWHPGGRPPQSGLG